jgi:hypothetical protein
LCLLVALVELLFALHSRLAGGKIDRRFNLFV